MRTTTVIRLVLATALLAVLAVAGGAASATDRASGPIPKGEALQRAAESMFADIQQASWVRDGRGAHVMYVFFDPNCPYCHKLYQELRPQVERGEVELRWIPIGLLTTTSQGKAAAILEAADPSAALRRNEENFSVETGSLGGVEEELVPRTDTLARLARNLALLRRSGLDSVPSLLFRDTRHQARFVLGAPPATKLREIVSSLE